MRPIEGILNSKTTKNFLKRLKKNGSKFSYRKIQNKSKKVYEANITVFNALQKSDFDKTGKFFLERYLSAHSIMISFDGIPALYFNSLFGKSNDEAKYIDGFGFLTGLLATSESTRDKVISYLVTLILF